MFYLQKDIYDTEEYYFVNRYCLPGCEEEEISYNGNHGYRYCCQGNHCNGSNEHVLDILNLSLLMGLFHGF